MIGFLNTSYTVSESDGVVKLQIGVIQGSIQRPIVVEISTGDISTAGELIMAHNDNYFKQIFPSS